MHKRYILPLFALIMAISGTAIRAAELGHAFEQGTGFHVQNSSITLIMLLFTGACLILFGLISVFFSDRTPKGYKLAPGEHTTLSKGLVAASGTVVLIAALAFLAVSFDEANSMNQTLPMSKLISVLLAVFAAGSIMIRSVKAGKEYTFFGLVPLYWSCFWLIIDYRDMSSNPTLLSYLYNLIAVILTVLFFSRVSGYDFDSAKVRLSIFIGLSSVYFCTVAAFAPVVAKLLYGSDVFDLSTTLYLSASVLFALGWLYRLLNPKFEKIPVQA